jgi:Ni/Fe-hydrogenase 1 B-type cytochrome subunit
VRIAHWLIFFSILILSVTGLYIAHPIIEVEGPARDHFMMGLVREIHLYTAIVFTLAVLVRIYWFFVGNRYARWGQYLPFSWERISNLFETVLYYSFIRRDPAEFEHGTPLSGGGAGHNALAGATYAFIFLVYLVLIVTGFGLYTVYAPQSSPMQVFAVVAQVLGGLEITRLVHHICMWIVLIFAIAHIYFVFLSSTVEQVGIFDSIFSGYKFLSINRAKRS